MSKCVACNTTTAAVYVCAGCSDTRLQVAMNTIAELQQELLQVRTAHSFAMYALKIQQES